MSTKYLKKTDSLDKGTLAFTDCQFGREKYADNLTAIIKNYPSGFVMALNNEWGMGKTTFLKMWQNQLVEKGINTVYFNAWENDFETSPLTALMAEFNASIDKSKVNEFTTTLLEYGSPIFMKSVPFLINSVIKKVSGIEINELVRTIEDSAVELLTKDINEYINRKESIVKFKNELSRVVQRLNTTGNPTPLVFIIDELDRCKPTYAVELLENIKHLFSVDEIVFVLSIDKSQLSSSIKGYFGSENFDSTDYLRKFIDFEYSLPEPSKETYINHLIDYYKLKDYFNQNSTGDNRIFHSNYVRFKSSTIIYLKNYSLRQIEKFFINVTIILRSFENDFFLQPSLVAYLVYLKTLKNKEYDEIQRKTISLDDLSSNYYFTVKENISMNNEELLVFTEALLIVFYNRTLPNYQFTKMLDYDSESNPILRYSSPLESEIQNENLAEKVRFVSESHEMRNVNLNYFIDRINLVNHITF